MRNKLWFLLVIVCCVTAGLLSSCTDDELKANITSVNLSYESGSSQQINIISNIEWNIVSCPDFVDVSAQSGVGDATIVVMAKNANNSGYAREGVLLIDGGDLTLSISIRQNCKNGSNSGSDGNEDDMPGETPGDTPGNTPGGGNNEDVSTSTAVVTPVDFVSSNTGMVWMYEWSNDVSYYYSTIIRESEFSKYSESELLNTLMSCEKVSDPTSIELYTDLPEDTEYYIVSVAYDATNIRGKITKSLVGTQSSYKQPTAIISDVKYSSGKWSWYVTKGNYATQYLQWVVITDNVSDTSYAVFILLDDVSLMWWLYKNAFDSDKYVVEKESNSFYINTNKKYIGIATWAADASNVMSGTISSVAYELSSNRIIEKRESNTPCVKHLNITMGDFMNSIQLVKSE